MAHFGNKNIEAYGTWPTRSIEGLVKQDSTDPILYGTLMVYNTDDAAYVPYDHSNSSNDGNKPYGILTSEVEPGTGSVVVQVAIKGAFRVANIIGWDETYAVADDVAGHKALELLPGGEVVLMRRG